MRRVNEFIILSLIHIWEGGINGIIRLSHVEHDAAVRYSCHKGFGVPISMDGDAGFFQIG